MVGESVRFDFWDSDYMRGTVLVGKSVGGAVTGNVYWRMSWYYVGGFVTG